MKHNSRGGRLGRRTLLKAGLAAGAAQFMGPFLGPAIIKARGEEPIKIGVDNPLTGIYTALGKNENTGMELAAEQINAKGGILGRQVQMVVEDSTSDKTDVAVQKARKLIQSDKVEFLIGNVNSSHAIAISQVAAELKTLHIVPGGHADTVTGASCHWTTFRVCNTGTMQGNAMAGPLINKIGKKYYVIAQDYAFGHSLADGLNKAAAKIGGVNVGTEFFPLGSTDYSAILIKARAANPDVIVNLAAGDDGINSIKQAVQFGLDKQVKIAGMQQELEVVEGLPPEARIGSWLFEWYWNQPNVPHVADFVAAIRKKTNKVPTARTWFGYAAMWTFGLVANQEKTTDAVKLAHALEGFKLPPEVALMPGTPYYRAEDHQLVPSAFVGHLQSKGKSDPEDLFVIDEVAKGPDFIPPPAETGCKLTYPT
ncbi:MAG TPA: ABC transporter substrate-binding protein [Xanthobacteraceae bacterium]|jgi:branched-chain amino acid transport system substrate-binding protein|nr:ABC transporter substrate-binding protein [Xanthobacteraceae bacterium]